VILQNLIDQQGPQMLSVFGRGHKTWKFEKHWPRPWYFLQTWHSVDFWRWLCQLNHSNCSFYNKSFIL